MRTYQVRSEAAIRDLDTLIKLSTPPTQYQNAMRSLGKRLGHRIAKLASKKRNGLLVCTPEDADYLAAGILEALQPLVEHLSLACFWNYAAGSDAPQKSLYLRVAPVIKRYEESTPESLDFIIIAKSIISTACVVKHNLLDIIDRKRPSAIFITAPVIYKGADEILKADFPSSVSKKFKFVYYAQDDDRDESGVVLPGIGGSVYKRLGFTAHQSKLPVPEVVKIRRTEHERIDLQPTTRAEKKKGMGQGQV